MKITMPKMLTKFIRCSSSSTIVVVVGIRFLSLVLTVDDVLVCCFVLFCFVFFFCDRVFLHPPQQTLNRVSCSYDIHILFVAVTKLITIER